MTDIDALGLTFYFLLTGRHPFRDLTSGRDSCLPLPDQSAADAPQQFARWQAKTQENLERLPFADLNGPLARLIRKMAAYDPEQRYQSYDVLLADLEAVIESLGKQIPLERLPSEPRPLLTGTDTEILRDLDTLLNGDQRFPDVMAMPPAERDHVLKRLGILRSIAFSARTGPLTREIRAKAQDFHGRYEEAT